MVRFRGPEGEIYVDGMREIGESLRNLCNRG